MAGYECGVDVYSTREVVWRYLTDSDGYPEWNRAIVHVAGPLRQGGHVITTGVDGSRSRFAVRTLEHESSMVWRRTVVPGLVTESLEFMLGDSANGVRVQAAQSVGGPLARLLGGAVPDRSAMLTGFLDSLKASVEQAPRGTSR
ncbi:MAG: hypothetical protein H6525_07255 [Actinobacteria bacterium]|nr:hypothetical protein [Actinomycetota bacterium]